MASKRYRSNEALGNLGEAVLALWAYDVGYVLNGSVDDRAGWDGLMEAPPDAADDSARQLGHQDTYGFRARIQVKATDKSTGRVPKVALSNWLRLAEAPDPAFFLVLEMGNKGTPQAAYLVHLDEAVIRGVLEQKRKNEVGPNQPLHTIYRALVYKDAPRIDPLSGEGLLAAIDAAVGSVLGDYVAWKRTLLLTAGFEAGHAAAVVKLTDGRPLTPADLGRVEVGLDASIPFERVDLHRLRFGEVDETPTLTIHGGAFVGPPPQAADSAELTIRVPTLGIEATTRGEIFVPKTAVALAREAGDATPLAGAPVRVQCGRIRFVAPVDGSTLSVSFDMPADPADPVPLRELRDLTAFAAAARRADDAGADIEIELRSGSGTTFSTGPVSPTVLRLDAPDLLAFADLAEATWRVCQGFDVADHVSVSVQAVVDQAPIIEFIDGAGQGDLDATGTFDFSFVDEVAAQTYDPDGTLTAFLCGLLFDDRRLLAVVQLGRATVASADGLARSIRAHSDSPKILYRNVSRTDEPRRDFQQIGNAVARSTGEVIFLAQHPHLITGRPDATTAITGSPDELA